MIAALWAVFSWPSSALADVCRDRFGRPAPQFAWTEWLRDLERRNLGAESPVLRRTMTDEERIRFLSAYNNEPPVTDYNPEHIEILSMEGSMTVVVVFVENGCVTLTARMMRWLVEGIISSNDGGGGLRPAAWEA